MLPDSTYPRQFVQHKVFPQLRLNMNCTTIAGTGIYRGNIFQVVQIVGPCPFCRPPPFFTIVLLLKKTMLLDYPNIDYNIQPKWFLGLILQKAKIHILRNFLLFSEICETARFRVLRNGETGVIMKFCCCTIVFRGIPTAKVLETLYLNPFQHIILKVT